MTRPQIIRADSIDLQDRDAPSAQDHKHPASKSTPNSGTNGSLAPHQAGTIREVEEERAEEEARSPRVSWANGDGGNDRDLQLYAEELASGIVNSLNGNKMQQQDALAIAQNGGVGGHADDDGDIDVNTDDDDLDDDMMDKISSSPSIEDGGCTLPPAWPARVDSLRNSLSSYEVASSAVASEARSSSPHLDLSGLLPLQLPNQQLSKASVNTLDSDHLLPGGYTGANEHDNHDEVANCEMLSDSEPKPQNPVCEETAAENLERLDEQNYLAQDRDSGIDLKIEDSSLNRPTSVDNEPVEDEIISPYEFLIPYVSSSSDDDEEEEDDFPFTDDCRFIDSGWGGECLQDAEDIDFEFVYALHTFVATVEGQANATKGDTMVLLDDSNSYWWLVRVVKDSSIGYLPAEHIETPTERLARLNKHRNIDLSATMLGDQADKARNPIMAAMKKRKAKNVSFAPPTVVNYPEIDYSDEEGEEDDGQDPQQVTEQEEQQQQAASQQATTDMVEEDESAKVEPLKPRNQKQVKIDPAKSEEAEKSEPSAKEPTPRSSDEFFDGKTERTTRNGTVRNTDSFFRDESIETKKITLTPGLLRDDNEPRASSDSKDLRQRPSLEKDLVPDKSKDDKKKKDKEKKDNKKPSAIRSFFSRKDKKKSLDDDDESFGKRSMDAGAGFGDTDMVEEPEEIESSPHKSPQRNPSKLQKQQPRNESSPTRKSGIISMVAADPDRAIPLAAEVKTNNVANVPPATVRMVESDQPVNQRSQEQKNEKNNNFESSNVLPADIQSKPLKVTKAKERVELDDFDSSEEEIVPEPTRAPPAEPQKVPSDEKLLRPTLPGSFPDSSTSIPRSESTEIQPPAEDLSESPVQVSPLTPSNPPALMGDNSSQEDRSSPVSSPSPEFADADSSAHKHQESAIPPVSTTATPTWNDANLRAFFDSGSEIRDLLVVVYDDKTDAAPVGPNHPIASSLFREQNAKLAEITTQLDNMLGDWLARKQRLRGTV
ncbi:hypothetical protein F5Y07DRAFT_395317 [Xylaria sp. FL0933]|nr:hypothetical protein F5Y07DRAFT_395317 [Xylaria sp. FL0933]